jgi:ABC-type molybdate transport system permease subunit
LIKGSMPTATTTTTTTTKQNVNPAVYFVYSRVKMILLINLLNVLPLVLNQKLYDFFLILNFIFELWRL